MSFAIPRQVGRVSRRSRRPSAPRRPVALAILGAGLSLLATGSVAGCRAARVTAPAGVAEPALPARYAVEFDSLLQTPRWVRNLDAVGAARPGAPAPFTDAVAAQIVRGFVRRYAPVFRLRPGVDDFASVWAEGRDGVNFVKVRQTYRGLPVEFMGYGTMVLGDGAMGSMIGRFLPGIAIAVVPWLTPEQAAARAVAALAPTPVRAGAPATLTVALIGDGLEPRLAWSLVATAEAGWWSWTVTVDAQDGTVLRVSQNWYDG